MKISAFFIVVTLSMWACSSFLTLGILPTSASMLGAAHSTSSPIKVLVFDWMSDPLLSYLNTLINESFDNDVSWRLRWAVGDLKPLPIIENGADYWGVTDYNPCQGNDSMYCARMDGLLPSSRHIYDDNMEAYLQTSVSLLSRSSATLGYAYWIKSEPNYDWLAVQVSTDLVPTTWVTLPNANYTGDSGGWINATKSLNSFVGEPIVWIRFLFHSDNTNHNYEGAYVDEVR